MKEKNLAPKNDYDLGETVCNPDLYPKKYSDSPPKEYLRILGYDYELVYATCIAQDYCTTGMIDFIDQKIYIKKDMSQAKVANTKMHEAIHGILDQLGYSDLNDDEHFVNVLSYALVKLINDNPKEFLC